MCKQEYLYYQQLVAFRCVWIRAGNGSVFNNVQTLLEEKILYAIILNFILTQLPFFKVMENQSEFVCISELIFKLSVYTDSNAQSLKHKNTHDVAGQRPATSWVHYTTSCNTQSSAPEDGRDNRPKPVELI